MNVDDLLVRFMAEFAFKILVWSIERVASTSFAQEVIHALYERWNRLGLASAVHSAFACLGQACLLRLETLKDSPLRALNWEEILNNTEGVRRSSRFAAGRLGENSYSFENISHPSTKDGLSRAGGYPLYPHIAFGLDRQSLRHFAAVPLHCGGTGGVLNVAVFARRLATPHLVGLIQQGDKQCAFVVDGALHIATPRRDPGEANCAWRRTRVVRYAVEVDALNNVSETIMTTAEFHQRYRNVLRTSSRSSGVHIAVHAKMFFKRPIDATS